MSLFAQSAVLSALFSGWWQESLVPEFSKKLVIVRGPWGGAEGDVCIVSIHPSLPISLFRGLLKAVPSFFVLHL